MARTLRSDKLLFWAALALVCTSIVMVVSASVFTQASVSTLKQFSLAVLGVIGMFVAMRVDYHYLQRPAVIWTLFGIAVTGLLAVFFFDEVNGARRWIKVPGMGGLQPSELAKLVAIIFAAAVLERRMHRINDAAYVLVPIGAVTGVLAVLIVMEPDLGTSAVLVLAVLAMVFAAGLAWRYLIGFFLLMLPVLTYFIVAFDFRQNRILAFIDCTSKHLDECYQLEQSQIALGSGGLFGLGLGKSVQKAYFLPEPHNDFIFSVIGEELGLIGTTAILLCFGVIVWRGLRAAILAPDRFGTLVGIGISMMVGMQAFINMSVVTGLAPTKGIPLPLVSAGGSSLLMNLVAMGILLNISQHVSSTAAASVEA